MILKYIFNQKKYWIILLLNLLLSLLIGFSFSGEINTLKYDSETLSNCTSKYIAFDKREFENNTYLYYGKNVKINLSQGDGILIDVDVYQFLEKNYDEKSIINNKNIKFGEYKDLKENEAAISEKTAKTYNLAVGDSIFVNSQTQYVIQYIYRNTYDLKNLSRYSTGDTIFIGTSDKILNPNYCFATFDDKTFDYNEVYLFTNIERNLKSNLYIYIFIELLLLAILEMLIIFMFKKSEYTTINCFLISGDRKKYFSTLFLVNLFLIFLPILLSSSILMIFNNLFIGFFILIEGAIITMLKIMYLRIKVR